MAMNKKALVTALIASGAIASGATHAAGLKNVEVDGGVSGMYILSTNNGGTGASEKDIDAITTPDMILNLSGGKKKTGGASFSATIGLINPVVVGVQARSEITEFTALSVIPQASVTAYPIDNLSLELGHLATTVGAETAHSYKNANITQGMLWNAQPAYYPGLRVGYAIDDITAFVELNSDTSQGSNNAVAVGANGKFGDISFSATYFDAQNSATAGNIIDVVFGMEAGDMTIGANLDMFMLDNSITGQDSQAFGVAAFLSPIKGDFEIPVRLEYLSAGTSGLFTTAGGNGIGKSAFTLTFTPTMKLNKDADLRAEVSYTNTDASAFTNTKNTNTTNNINVALQTTYRF